MLEYINYTVPSRILQEVSANLPEFDRRIDLNVPTGDFFYDKWVVSPEFKNTIWEELLNTLPLDFGQARLMKLEPEQCYRTHADADNRYHLTLSGTHSFLIDLDTQTMHPTQLDGKWYLMDASRRHSAVNFGETTRVQLVIRKLLTRGNLSNPTTVEISIDPSVTNNFRYIFDDIFSPWINTKDQLGLINNFKMLANDRVSFTTENYLVQELLNICPDGFNII